MYWSWNGYCDLVLERIFCFERIFHFGRMCWSWKCIFLFGRVLQSWNEQCCHGCYCHSFKLGFGHMVGREGCELLKYHKLLQPHFPEVLNTIALWCLWQLDWYQQVWIQGVQVPSGSWLCVTTSSWNVSDTGHWVALEPGLFPGLEGTSQWNHCLCNVRVIGSISIASNDQFRYRLWLGMRIFLFGRMCWSWNVRKTVIVTCS